MLRLLVGPDPEHGDRLLATGAEDDPVGMRAIALYLLDGVGNHGDAQISKARAQLAVRLPYAVGQDGQFALHVRYRWTDSRTMSGGASKAIGWSRCSHPSQNGHWKTPLPQYRSMPGMFGKISRTPVARITVRDSRQVALVQRHLELANFSRHGDRRSVRTDTLSYGRNCSWPIRRSSAGGVPSRVKKLCDASDGAFRPSPVSSKTTDAGRGRAGAPR